MPNETNLLAGIRNKSHFTMHIKSHNRMLNDKCLQVQEVLIWKFLFIQGPLKGMDKTLDPVYIYEITTYGGPHEHRLGGLFWA